MKTNKQSRTKLTLEVKKLIIEAHEKEKLNHKELVSKFNIPRTTIIGILNSKLKINKMLEEGIGKKRNRMRVSKNEDLEQAVLIWFKQIRSQNFPITGQLVQEKAKEIASLLNINSFCASNGWLEKFLKSHSISFKKNQGEAGSINMKELINWQDQILQDTIKDYSPDDIFNVDETGLFWRLLPNKTLAFKGDRCTSGKKSKERITILVGANMTGTIKLPLLAIGKSENPRCFKNAKIPVEYKANNNAWMTASIFETWLKKWNEMLRNVGKHVLLFVDNCSVHRHNTNTTAEAQPMDQGIIQNLKVHYKSLLLRKEIKAIDYGIPFKFDLLNALHLLYNAWDQITPSTIKGCFRKAKFVITQDLSQESNEANEENELILFWEKLRITDSLDEKITLEDYITVDNDLATDGVMTLKNIAASVIDVEDCKGDEEEELEEFSEVPIVSTGEAYQALITLRNFMERNVDDISILKMCDIFDKEISKKRSSELRQTTLFEYKFKR